MFVCLWVSEIQVYWDADASKNKVRIVKDQSIYNNADCVCALVCITLMYYIVSRSRGTIFAIQGALIP